MLLASLNHQNIAAIYGFEEGPAALDSARAGEAGHYVRALGQFAPDGRWIAFQSDESGRFEIYLRSVPDAKSQIRVSATGGAQARWRRDGNELFYVALDNRLMSVPIRQSETGTLGVGTPTPLFMTRIGGALLGPRKQQYVVARDGQRFLMNTVTAESSSPLRVVLNWKPAVSR